MNIEYYMKWFIEECSNSLSEPNKEPIRISNHIQPKNKNIQLLKGLRCVMSVGFIVELGPGKEHVLKFHTSQPEKKQIMLNISLRTGYTAIFHIWRNNSRTRWDKIMTKYVLEG